MPMETKDWITIVGGAVLTGALGVGGSMLVFHWQARDPHLAYRLTPTTPFSGSKGVTAIYQVSFFNDGNKEAESVDCDVSITGAKIEDKHVIPTPANLAYILETPGENSVKLKLANLNPTESVDLSFLATAQSNLPPRPQVWLRAKGVNGEERPVIVASVNSSPTWTWAVGAIAVLIGALGGTIKKLL